MRSSLWLLLTVLPLTPASAASTATTPVMPGKQQVRPASPRKPVTPRLVALEVLPSKVRLVGARAEQSILVTGRYTDGSRRDMTASAALKTVPLGVVSVRKDGSHLLLRPIADGKVRLTVTAPGAPPATVYVEVVDAKTVLPISFRHDVIPALTKAGCSQGTCHGTPTGKGGFRLSLQGYAPELDYQTLAREGGGRRVNSHDPGRSLLLLKAMSEVPHGGGRRLTREMPEFGVLSRWIVEGARDDPPTAPHLESLELLPGVRTLKLPGARQQIAAIARYSDGTTRDVTSLAKLTTSDEELGVVSREGLVEGRGRGDLAVVARYEDRLVTLRLTFLRDVPGFRWSAPPIQNYVDTHVFQRLRLLQIPPSGLCSDTEFLRRAYLDAMGVLPTPEEVRAFLADPSPDKRERVIAKITERPEFADYWALKWADVLRIQDETLTSRGAKAYHNWLRDNLAANRPFDQIVRELLTASGSTYNHPAANYFRSLQQPDQLSEATAQLFLGVRMTCARCHNHPFERWTQDEYYSLAAFFAQVRREGGPTDGEQTIYLKPKGEVTHLRTGQVMRPKLLGAGFPQFAPEADRRQALAEWMTRKENPFFAKAVVNRVWANLLGRGIVEPVDDFRASNPPSNEALLEALAADFAKGGFDLRRLARTIMNSRTYQLSARTNALNAADEVYFSHALATRLPAEPLADAISQVLGVPEEYPGYPRGIRAVQLSGTSGRTPFLKTFGRPDRNLNCECEREKDPTLFQALKLITDRDIAARLHDDTGRVAALARSSKPVAAMLEELYLASLSRLPSERERKKLLGYLAAALDRRAALEDVTWALINSKEFQFRH